MAMVEVHVARAIVSCSPKPCFGTEAWSWFLRGCTSTTALDAKSWTLYVKSPLGLWREREGGRKEGREGGRGRRGRRREESSLYA